MSILATLWFPSSNPVGPPSVLAGGLLLLLFCLTCKMAPIRPAYKRAISVASPFLLWIPLLIFEGPLIIGGRCFPDADDFAAVYTALITGFAFSLDNFRFLSWPYRLNASVFTLFYGTLIVYQATPSVLFLVWRHGAVVRYTNGWIAIVAILSFGLLWIPTLIYLNKKVKRRLRDIHSLCRHCEYNLTGNISGICPECGKEIKQPIPEMNPRKNPINADGEPVRV